MRAPWRTAITVCSLVALLAACSEQGGEPGPAAGGSGGASTMGGHSAAGGDEGDDCTAAVDLQSATNSLGGLYYEHQGALDPAGDRDSFRFEAEAGEWFTITTRANPGGDPGRIDTVLTLLDEAGSAPLARSDDAPLPARPDSEIIHRFALAGRYCVQVSEHADLLGSEPRGGPSFAYRLRVVPVDSELYDDWNLDAEPNDERTVPQPLTVVPYQGHSFTRFVGQLGAEDVDVSRFVVGELGQRLILSFTPSGPTGHGAPLGPGVVRLRHPEPEGGIIAELDYQSRPAAGYLLDAPNDLPFGMVVPVAPEQPLLLEVAPPVGATVPAEDFYAVSFLTEVASGEGEPNDVSIDASTQATVDQTPGTTRHDFAGQLPGGDVDWWRTNELAAGGMVELSCASWQLGSSLRDATFTLFAGGGYTQFPTGDEEPLQAQTETGQIRVRWSDDPTKQPTMPAVTVQESDLLYLRVTATTYEPSVESVFYSCRITLREP